MARLTVAKQALGHMSRTAELEGALREAEAGESAEFDPAAYEPDARSSIQGSMTGIPQCSKSAPLRAATAAPLARAMAAIWQSASRIGRPMERREAAIVA